MCCKSNLLISLVILILNNTQSAPDGKKYANKCFGPKVAYLKKWEQHYSFKFPALNNEITFNLTCDNQADNIIIEGNIRYMIPTKTDVYCQEKSENCTISNPCQCCKKPDKNENLCVDYVQYQEPYIQDCKNARGSCVVHVQGKKDLTSKCASSLKYECGIRTDGTSKCNARWVQLVYRCNSSAVGHHTTTKPLQLETKATTPRVVDPRLPTTITNTPQTSTKPSHGESNTTPMMSLPKTLQPNNMSQPSLMAKTTRTFQPTQPLTYITTVAVGQNNPTVMWIVITVAVVTVCMITVLFWVCFRKRRFFKDKLSKSSKPLLNSTDTSDIPCTPNGSEPANDLLPNYEYIPLDSVEKTQIVCVNYSESPQSSKYQEPGQVDVECEQAVANKSLKQKGKESGIKFRMRNEQRDTTGSDSSPLVYNQHNVEMVENNYYEGSFNQNLKLGFKNDHANAYKFLAENEPSCRQKSEYCLEEKEQPLYEINGDRAEYVGKGKYNNNFRDKNLNYKYAKDLEKIVINRGSNIEMVENMHYEDHLNINAESKEHGDNGCDSANDYENDFQTGRIEAPHCVEKADKKISGHNNDQGYLNNGGQRNKIEKLLLNNINDSENESEVYQEINENEMIPNALPKQSTSQMDSNSRNNNSMAISQYPQKKHSSSIKIPAQKNHLPSNCAKDSSQPKKQFLTEEQSSPIIIPQPRTLNDKAIINSSTRTRSTSKEPWTTANLSSVKNQTFDTNSSNRLPYLLEKTDCNSKHNGQNSLCDHPKQNKGPPMFKPIQSVNAQSMVHVSPEYPENSATADNQSLEIGKQSSKDEPDYDYTYAHFELEGRQRSPYQAESVNVYNE